MTTPAMVCNRVRSRICSARSRRPAASSVVQTNTRNAFFKTSRWPRATPLRTRWETPCFILAWADACASLSLCSPFKSCSRASRIFSASTTTACSSRCALAAFM
eukprot:2721485-Rhodomonas_salina.1